MPQKWLSFDHIGKLVYFFLTFIWIVSTVWVYWGMQPAQPSLSAKNSSTACTCAFTYWQFNLLLRGHEYFSFELSTKYTSDGKIPASEWSSNIKGTKKMPLHPYISHAVICIANPTECHISDRALTLDGCARLHGRNANTLLSLKAWLFLRW